MKGEFVGRERVIVENKATEELSHAPAPQLINYLRATSFEVGVLLHSVRKRGSIVSSIFPNDR